MKWKLHPKNNCVNAKIELLNLASSTIYDKEGRSSVSSQGREDTVAILEDIIVLWMAVNGLIRLHW